MMLTGEEAFLLYDTYGLPLELMVLKARERRVGVDWQGFFKMARGRNFSNRRLNELCSTVKVVDKDGLEYALLSGLAEIRGVE